MNIAVFYFNLLGLCRVIETRANHLVLYYEAVIFLKEESVCEGLFCNIEGRKKDYRAERERKKTL